MPDPVFSPTLHQPHLPNERLCSSSYRSSFDNCQGWSKRKPPIHLHLSLPNTPRKPRPPSLAHPAEGLSTAYIAAPSTAPVYHFESASWWLTFTASLLGILAATAIYFLNWKTVNILSDSQLCLVMQDDFTSSLNSDNWIPEQHRYQPCHQLLLWQQCLAVRVMPSHGIWCLHSLSFSLLSSLCFVSVPLSQRVPTVNIIQL
jgi:hypothetical protein